jgi:hypothetical protein
MRFNLHYSNPRCKAVIAVVALALTWAGTAGMTFGGIPEIAGVSLFDTAGNELVDSGGNILRSSPERSAVNGRNNYLWFAIPSFLLISLGMALQAIEPLQIAMRKGDTSDDS